MRVDVYRDLAREAAGIHRCVSPVGRARVHPLLIVFLALHLDSPLGIRSPQKRTELGRKLVILGVNIDLVVYEQLPQLPVPLRSGVGELLGINRSLAPDEVVYWHICLDKMVDNSRSNPNSVNHGGGGIPILS